MIHRTPLWACLLSLWTGVVSVFTASSDQIRCTCTIYVSQAKYEQYANIWNLFNRGFIKLNILKIIYIYCYNNDFDNTIQKYYNYIGGEGLCNISIDNLKLFHKTCYNIIKYFNKKIKKAADDRIVLSYLYAIYADDDGVHFNEDHEIQENKAYDILHDNGLLKDKTENIADILDLLYELYLQ